MNVKELFHDEGIWKIEVDGVLRKLGTIAPIDRGLTLASGYQQLKSVAEKLTHNMARKLIDDGLGDRTKLFGDEFVHDQKSVGSCNGWAGATSDEKSRVLNGQPHVRLSGTSLYSRINFGQDQGSLLKDGMREIQNGVSTEAACPWDKWHASMVSAAAKAEYVRFRAHEPLVIDDELDLLTAILTLKSCPVVAVHVTNAFMNLDDSGLSGGGNGPGNHAVHVDSVRWNVAKARYEYRNANSWGLQWGLRGFSWLTWAQHFAPTRKFHEFYTITAASEDEADSDNPPVIN